MKKYLCAIFLLCAATGPAFAAWDLLGISFAEDSSFPRSENIVLLDVAVLDVHRLQMSGVGLSLGTSKYQSVYGIQTAFLSPHAKEEFWGMQCGLMSIVNKGCGIQLGLFTCCDNPRWVVQAGLMNMSMVGFMNDNGWTARDRRRLQLGLLNQSEGGVQIGVANFHGTVQIGLFNTSNSGFMIGLVNCGTWITPIIGW